MLALQRAASASHPQERPSVWLGDRRRRARRLQPMTTQGPWRRIARRFVRAAVTVATSVTFFSIHDRCATWRAAEAQELVCYRPHADVDTRTAAEGAEEHGCTTTVVGRESAVASAARRPTGQAWKNVNQNLDWNVLAAGALLAAAI